MRYVFLFTFLTLSTLASESYVPIGSQMAKSAYKAQKEALAAELRLTKLEDELRYSRERQAIREEKLFDRMERARESMPAQVIRYSSRIGRVRDNDRVR